MLKKIFLLSLSVLILTACTNTPSPEDKYNIKDPKTSLRNVEIETQVTDIQLADNNISFDVTVTRPDLETPTTEDIPIGLQTRLMYLTPTDSNEFGDGSMCSRHMSISHRCPNYTGTEIDPTKAGQTEKFLIQIVFEDDTYAEKVLEISVPESLPKSKILFPLSIPAQNDKFKISFVDVGADEYDVSFRLCHPYDNNGINPCLEGDDYKIIKESKDLKMTTSSTAKPTKSITGDVITIESMYPLTFSESIDYTIAATKQYALPDGTKVFLTSNNLVSFPLSTP